jgi:protein arginine N-methyltransferase 7
MLEQIFCPYCASAQQVVDVHGHKQCVKCGINVSPCCSGEQADAYEENERAVEKDNLAFSYFLLIIRGNAFRKLQKFDEAITSYNKAIQIKPDYALAYSNLGITLMKQKNFSSALGHIANSIKLNPNSVSAQLSYNKCLASLVPEWHTSMMNDQLRNNAYLKAIQSAVKHHSHVLEIGTGSGIISMMAARCNAKKITTCEMSPLIAQTAVEIIKENGLSKSINVVPIKSTELKIGVDLPHRADILVSEILSSELLGEGVLSSIEDAKHRLLYPDAQIIPRKASVRVALFGGDDIGRFILVDNVNGFNLSKFNKIRSKKRLFNASFYNIELLSNTEDAFIFDFMDESHFLPEKKTLEMPVQTEGKCYGIIQWIHLQMDDTITFENNPLNKTIVSGWAHVVYLFDTPLYVRANQVIKISAIHDRNAPWFALESVL